MLRLPARVYDMMVRQSVREAPLECCGLICGNAEHIELIPLRNQMSSPIRYDADPHDLVAAFREMRLRRYELIAIYHSHPSSPARPSSVDLEQNYYGDVPRIIISLQEHEPVVKAFILHETDFDEIECKRIGYPEARS